MKRNCPKCNKLLEYKSKGSFYTAKKKKSLCRSCANKGENNPMYGKSNYEFWVKKYGKEIADVKMEKFNQDRIKRCQSQEFKEKMSEKFSGENNPMYGKNFYSLWLDKYGEKIADEKMDELKKKHSKNNSGVNNPMYGRPSPNGSGNGWKGWYKEYFFKSLRELKMVMYFEENDIDWVSADNKKFMISYIDWDGKNRNYFPDFFIINEKKIIECKPKHLFNSKNVKQKRKYAEKFCKIKGYKYEIIDPGRIENKIVIELYRNGDITLLPKYEDKIKSYL